MVMNTILYIEDETDIQEVARMALEEVGGFTVRVASSGKEGIALAQSVNPDLILLDVMMPGMDGPTTLRELRRLPATASIPVIFMTAKVQRHEVEQYRKMGALDVIPKPFDPMELPNTVRKIVDEATRTVAVK
jgi:two-component system OmpR family response regulator